MSRGLERYVEPVLFCCAVLYSTFCAARSEKDEMKC
jgi:hypothetical protein